jgi:predicted transcriptional regulator
MTRYYPIAIDSSEFDILDYIQDSTRRKIILLLLEHSDCRFREIVHYIDKAQSTTSSHLLRLERAGIFSVLRFYPINTPDEEFDIIGYMRNEPSINSLVL